MAVAAAAPRKTPPPKKNAHSITFGIGKPLPFCGLASAGREAAETLVKPEWNSTGQTLGFFGRRQVRFSLVHVAVRGSEFGDGSAHTEKKI